MSSLRDRVVAMHGESFLRKSAMNIRGGAGVFEKVLAGRGYRVLEIGTYRGVGAAAMAEYAVHVTTIDLAFGKLEQNGTPFDRRAFWDSLGITNIDFRPVVDNVHKAEVIDSLDFDLAFIDGAHHANAAAADFALVKRCGRVLFHDYDKNEGDDKNYVYDFVNSLPREQVTVMDIFALWVAPWQVHR